MASRKTDTRAVLFMSPPHRRIADFLAGSELDPDLERSIRSALKTLRGPMRVQDGGDDRLWIVYHGEILKAYEELYARTGLQRRGLDIRQVFIRHALIHIALAEALGEINLADGLSGDLHGEVLDDIRNEFALERGELSGVWLEGYVLHVLNRLYRLEAVLPETPRDDVQAFLEDSTSRLAAAARPGSEVLFEQLRDLIAAAVGERSWKLARRALLESLDAVKKDCGERDSRIRRLPLKSRRRKDAADRLRASVKALPKPEETKATSGQGRKRRRQGSKRVKAVKGQRHARLRSRRIMRISRSSMDIEVPAELRARVVDDAKPVNDTPAKKRPARAKVARTSKDKRTGGKPSRQDRERERSAKGRSKRRARSLGRMRSQRIARWSASRADVALDNDELAQLRAAFEARQGKARRASGSEERSAKAEAPEAIETKPAKQGRKKAKKKRSVAEPSELDPKAKKKADKEKRRRQRERDKRGKRRKSKPIERLQSKRLVAWTNSQELDAIVAPETPAEETKKPAKTEKRDKPKSGQTETKEVRSKGGQRKRRRSRKGFNELAVAGGVVLCLGIAYMFVSGLDFNKTKRAALSKAVAQLEADTNRKPGLMYTRIGGLRKRVQRYQKAQSADVDQSFADEQLRTLESVEDESGTLIKRWGRQLIRGGLNSNEGLRRAEQQLLIAKSWKLGGKNLGGLVSRLEGKINEAQSWLGFGKELVELVDDNAKAAVPELHLLVAADLADERDRDVIDALASALEGAKKGEVQLILSELERERFHPAIGSSLYRQLASRARKQASRAASPGHQDAITRLRHRMEDLAPIAEDYEKVMEAAYQRLEGLDLATAITTVEGSRYSSKHWYRLVLGWLTSPAAKSWVEAMKPEEAGPVVVAKPEQGPAIAKPKAAKKAARVVDRKKTYKERFILGLGELAQAKGERRKDLIAGLEGDMRESLELLKSSPAFAYDACEFYGKHRRLFGREASLKALHEQHKALAFKTIRPSLTGPAGFSALKNWCKTTKYEVGIAQLKPLLEKVRPVDRANAVYARQLKLREKRSGVAETVQGFVSKRRVENARAIRRLVDFLAENQLNTPEVNSDLKRLIDTLIAKVGGDSNQARSLLARVDKFQGKDHTPARLESLVKTYRRRASKIRTEAENSLVDAVTKCLKAKEPAVGYDILQDALIVNPTSDRIFKGLKYKKVDGEWMRPWDAGKRGKGLSWSRKIGWHKGELQPGKYWNSKGSKWADLAAADQQHQDANNPWVLESEHFQLRSTASLQESVTVITRLEAFYLQLFRQFDVFFAPNGNALVVFGLAKQKPLVVNYYRTNAQFKQHANPPSDWAAGFYSGGKHASFFYSTPGDWTVLQHEIVHQILGESKFARGGSESWLAEGVAVYMENAYFDSDARLQLGGVSKHQRPYRYLREARSGSVTITFNEVINLKSSGQWGQGNIADHYKGAGSVVFFFMTFDGGRYRGDFLDYLRSCYGGGAAGDLPHYLGISYQSMAWLFESFYKNGFTNHQGVLVSHDEKLVLDRELIERIYPDPGKVGKPLGPKNKGKGAKEKQAPKELSQDLKALVRTLKSNPSLERRRQAAEALAANGEDGKAALREGLVELLRRQRDAILKYVKRKRGSLQRKLAGEVTRRRQDAYDFIMDPGRYPDANHGKAAQPAVDKLVNALRAAYSKPFEALVGDGNVADSKLKELVARYKAYHDWQVELAGAAPSFKKDREEMGKEAAKTLKIDKIPLTPDDQKIKEQNKLIDAYNKRTKTLMNAEEKACVDATNDYRALFGLRKLKYFDPLVRAARGHSNEMVKLRFFDHTSPTPANRTPKIRCEREGAKFSGENIAMGHPTGVAAFWGWYNSSGHHRNILTKGHLSIGVGQNNRHWTQNFGRDNPK